MSTDSFFMAKRHICIHLCDCVTGRRAGAGGSHDRGCCYTKGSAMEGSPNERELLQVMQSCVSVTADASGSDRWGGGVQRQEVTASDIFMVTSCLDLIPVHNKNTTGGSGSVSR